MNIRRFFFLGVVALITLQSASGQEPLDTWTFRGVLTTGLAGSPYQAGLPYSVNFAIDTARLSPDNAGLYFPTLGYDFSVNSSGFGASSLGSGVLIANDRPTSGGDFFDGIVFSMFGEQSTGFPTGTMFDGSAFGVTLVSFSTSPTASPFTDTTFPSALDLNQFSQRDTTVYFQSGAVRGSVDSLFINGVLISQVPEPGSMTLFAVGISVLLGCQLRQCKRPNTRCSDSKWPEATEKDLPKVKVC